MKRLVHLLCAAVVALEYGSLPAEAATISVGAYTYSATDPFIVPIEITGAVDLASFAFDVDFDATAYMINTACAPFSDSYCDFTTGPVTLGPFYTNAAMYPPLFNPGFILLDGSGNQTGQLVGVNGAWQDPGPAPSGDGILAFIEFIALTGGSSDGPITVVGSPTLSTTVDEPVLPGLMAVGALAFVVEQRRARSRRWA